MTKVRIGAHWMRKPMASYETRLRVVPLVAALAKRFAEADARLTVNPADVLAQSMLEEIVRVCTHIRPKRKAIQTALLIMDRLDPALRFNFINIFKAGDHLPLMLDDPPPKPPKAQDLTLMKRVEYIPDMETLWEEE